MLLVSLVAKMTRVELLAILAHKTAKDGIFGGFPTKWRFQQFDR
jgi:hypothetical protein